MMQHIINVPCSVEMTCVDSVVASDTRLSLEGWLDKRRQIYHSEGCSSTTSEPLFLTASSLIKYQPLSDEHKWDEECPVSKIIHDSPILLLSEPRLGKVSVTDHIVGVTKRRRA